MGRPYSPLQVAAVIVVIGLCAASFGAGSVNAADGRRVERVLLTESWDVGYGGMMVLKYRPVVLYADGTLTYDAARAASGEARIAGRWRPSERGNVSLTALDSKRSTEVSSNKAGRPARPKQTLSGRYSSFSGVGGGGTGTTSVAAWRNYDFAADGTVRFGGGAGSSTPKNTNDKASVVTRSSANSAARYSLDGHTITSTFADGSAQRMLFYFMGSKDDMIVVGARTLSKGSR
jgi:hypothetical protein